MTNDVILNLKFSEYRYIYCKMDEEVDVGQEIEVRLPSFHFLLAKNILLFFYFNNLFLFN